MTGVILALERPSVEEAVTLVDLVGESADFYKVGPELYTSVGPDVVRALRDRGKRVFLDLKLHDIPSTVAGAVRIAATLDVELLSVHASGGATMLEAAREAAEGRVGILGVTVLTSLKPAELEQVWGREIVSIREEVRRLAEMAFESGLTGVVASALEAGWVRQSLGQDFMVVTPGIRPTGGDVSDQARVATPAAAVEAGSDYLVVGRPVTAAPDPAAALRALLAEVAEATPADGD